jgi:acetyl esterase/lipase
MSRAFKCGRLSTISPEEIRFMPVTPSPLAFSDADLAQARAMNRRLAYMPRFRAPGVLRKFMIQSMIRAQTVLAPVRVPGVTIRTQRIIHKGWGVDLRILKGASSRGVYIDIHGGGWSIGSAAMDDPVNARIAADCGLTVVSIDYGLLPETSFPDMVAQCAAAADWVFEQPAFPAGPIFLGGESAGAHLAACTLLRLCQRVDFARLAGCVLFYGVYDLSSTPSVRAAPAAALVLHGPSMRTGIASLLPDRDEAGLRAPDYSPLHADLAGLPPMLLLCGTIDPLIDDTTLFADALARAGVETELATVPDAPHAFNRLFTQVAAKTNARVRTWLDARMAAGAASRAAAE